MTDEPLLAKDFYDHCVDCGKCTDDTDEFCEKGKELLDTLVGILLVKHKANCEVCARGKDDFCITAAMTVPGIIGGMWAQVAKFSRIVMYGDPDAPNPPRGILINPTRRSE